MTEPGVPLKEHLEEISAANRRTIIVGIAGVSAVGGAILWGMMKATAVALTKADQILAAHNDLIRKGERDSAASKATYITRDSVRAAVTMLAACATAAIGYFALTGGH